MLLMISTGKVVYIFGLFWGYLYSYKCLCLRYWLIDVHGTSKQPKFYRNDFKDDLYCRIWWWFEISTSNTVNIYKFIIGML